MRRRPFHPLLLGAYPALFLFAHNRAQLEWTDLVAPLIIGVVFAAGVWAARFALCRDAALAAILCTPWLLASLGHGLVVALLPAPVAATWAARMGAAVGLVIVAFAADRGLARWLADDPTAQGRAARVLEVVALTLVALPLLQLASPLLRGGLAPDGAGNAEAAAPIERTPGAPTPPDIYFIVLDGFGSRDVLARVYDYDATPFLDDLAAMGFVAPAHSHANYPRTVHSLAATLNYAYLSPAAGELADVPNGLGPLVHGIRRNKLFRFLSRAGYTTYSLESGYPASELRAVDHYVSRPFTLRPFARSVLAWTPLPTLLEGVGLGPEAAHRARIRFAFETLPRLARAPGPKFVFAHILAPHPPFVFDAAGGARPATQPYELYDGSHYLRRATPDDYVRGYRDQVAFVSAALTEAIRQILEASPAPPIIVVQGDHGPGLGFDHERVGRSDLAERMSILNAILLPEGLDRGAIPDDLAPVNTFRLILAQVFPDVPEAATLVPLPNRSFYTRESRPYAFIDVTDRLDAPGRGPAR